MAVSASTCSEHSGVIWSKMEVAA